MPRQHARSVKAQVNNTHRYCLYCQAHRDKRGFDKHHTACKIIWQKQQRRQNPPAAKQLEQRTQAENVVNLPVDLEVRVQSVNIHVF
jgi:hypothetical protein